MDRLTNQQIADAHRVLVWIGVIRQVLDFRRIEDHDIGKIAAPEHPTILQREIQRRQSAQFANGGRQGEGVLLAHVLREQPGKVAVSARVGLGLQEHALRGRQTAAPHRLHG